MSALDDARRRFAEQMAEQNGLRSEALVRALATVPREQFVGPGPWLTLPDAGGYRSTPDASAVHLYEDVAVAIDAARLLNNGAPGLLARLIDAMDLHEGATVAQIGCGTGYYAAILGEIVGPSGRVLAVELDPGLHTRARKTLRRSRWIEVRHADGIEEPSEPVDGLLVSAGVTHPRAVWLDALRPDASLVLPLTAIRPNTRVRRFLRDNAGRMLQVRRRPGGYSARFAEVCGIHPMVGGRDPSYQRELRGAFEGGGADAVRSLRRDAHEREAECWLHGADFCLSGRGLGE